MKAEDAFLVKLQRPIVRKQLQLIKKEWGLNQTSYKHIGDYIKDSRLCYKVGVHNPKTIACKRLRVGNYFTIRDGKKVRLNYQDQIDFMNEVAVITNNLNLPLRIADRLVDYLVYKKLILKTHLVGIGIERDALRNDMGKVLLHIDPDVRLADVKREWYRVRKIQNTLNQNGKKNRSPKNIEVVIKSQNEKTSGKKYSTLDVIDDSQKDRFDPKAAANARQMKYRYKKI